FSKAWEGGVNVEEDVKNLAGHLRQRIQSAKLQSALARNTVLPVLARHATLQPPSPDGKGQQRVVVDNMKKLAAEGLLWASDLSTTRYTSLPCCARWMPTGVE
ncbi:unnamed protein product, partial [Effrenium voratum]